LERLWRWCRRNPGLAAVTGIAALASLVAGGLAVVIATYRPPPAPSEKPAAAPSEKRPQPAEQPKRKQLSTEVVKRVTRSTVYVEGTMPNRDVAAGSGFFAVEPGIVLTTAQALGMRRSVGSIPAAVRVIVNGGEPDEWACPAEVLAIDRRADLAVLRVAGTKQMPEPLKVISAGRLKFSGAPVYVVGFPSGQVNRAPSIRVSDVDSV